MGFRMNISKKIKKFTNLKVRTSGMLNNINLIKSGLKNKSFDYVAIARPFLKNPNWIFENVKNTEYQKVIPNQYLRG